MSAVNSLVSMERVRLLKGVKATTFLEADALPSFSLKKKQQNKKKKPVWGGMVCETNGRCCFCSSFIISAPRKHPLFPVWKTMLPSKEAKKPRRSSQAKCGFLFVLVCFFHTNFSTFSSKIGFFEKRIDNDRQSS